MSAAQTRGLSGVDVFFSPEVVANVAPPDAAAVCILHSLPDGGLKPDELSHNAARYIESNPTVIRTFDYLVPAVRQSPALWQASNYDLIQRVYPAKFLTKRRKQLDIVPGGYPKLDYSRRILQSAAPLDTLIYSPTADHVALGHVQRDGATILATLLHGFPGMNVVFRPYPHRPDVEFGRQLAQRFQADPRFSFDDSATGIRSQRRSALIVTDSSSSALTFSLSTYRPLVFVDLAKGAGGDVPAQNPFGFNATSVAELAAAVRHGLQHAEQWSARIAAHADEFLYHPGTAAAYLASHLERFARRESHPDWLSVDRKPMPSADRTPNPAYLKRLRVWNARIGNARSAMMLNEVEAFFAKTPARKGSA
jgi:hypothetical protein